MNCRDEIAKNPPVSMPENLFDGDRYQTPELKISTAKKLLTWNAPHFYSDFFRIIINGAKLAKNNQYDRQHWFDLSCRVISSIENHGGVLDVSGMDNFHKIDGPVLFVSNHMSILETIVLPALILKHKELCITMKKQLFDVPVFGTLLSGFRTVVVSRVNPINDYKTIIKDGGKAIEEGYSTLLFPQTTRTTSFNPDEFNSVGVKLAKRTKVKIIPIALKTDFWGNGKILKDLGPIDRKKKIYFSFGEPITISGNGKEENQYIINFIQENLSKWK